MKRYKIIQSYTFSSNLSESDLWDLDMTLAEAEEKGIIEDCEIDQYEIEELHNED